MTLDNLAILQDELKEKMLEYEILVAKERAILKAHNNRQLSTESSGPKLGQGFNNFSPALEQHNLQPNQVSPNLHIGLNLSLNHLNQLNHNLDTTTENMILLDRHHNHHHNHHHSHHHSHHHLHDDDNTSHTISRDNSEAEETGSFRSQISLVSTATTSTTVSTLAQLKQERIRSRLSLCCSGCYLPRHRCRCH